MTFLIRFDLKIKVYWQVLGYVMQMATARYPLQRDDALLQAEPSSGPDGHGRRPRHVNPLPKTCLQADNARPLHVRGDTGPSVTGKDTGGKPAARQADQHQTSLMLNARGTVTLQLASPATPDAAPRPPTSAELYTLPSTCLGCQISGFLW